MRKRMKNLSQRRQDAKWAIHSVGWMPAFAGMTAWGNAMPFRRPDNITPDQDALAALATHGTRCAARHHAVFLRDSAPLRESSSPLASFFSALPSRTSRLRGGRVFLGLPFVFLLMKLSVSRASQ